MAGGAARGLGPPLALSSCCLLFCVAVVSSSFDFVVKPEFGEAELDLNVTTFLGQTGRLPCTVRHLAGKRVSWIRGRDLQVLSTGRITFSTDLRISVLPGTSNFKSRKVRSVGSGISRGRCVGEASNSSSAGDGGSVGDDARRRESGRCVLDYGGGAGSEASRQSSRQDSRQDSRQHDRYTRTHGHVSKKMGKHRRDAFVYGGRVNHEHGRKSSRRGSHSDRRRRTELRKHPDPQHHGSRRRNRREHRYANHFYDAKRNRKSSPGKMSLFGRAATSHDTSHSYSEYNSPIAIYPQGRAAQAAGDNKALHPGPNYIEGVWEPEDYTLQIKYTKPEDAGTYLCQINTEPRISQVVHLNVVKMKAVIVGSSELFVKAGNPVTLACRVNHGTLMPGFILWYKNELLVEYGRRVQVRTGDDGVSHLLLRQARPSDSANYTCSPSNGAPASLILNVIVDERQAAMQQGNTASHPASPSLSWALTGGLLLTAASTAGEADVAGSRGSSIVALGGLMSLARSLLPPVPDLCRWVLWSTRYLLSALTFLLSASLTPLRYSFCLTQYLLSAALAPLTCVPGFPLYLLFSLIPFCYFCCCNPTTIAALATLNPGRTSQHNPPSSSPKVGLGLTSTRDRLLLGLLVGLLLGLLVGLLLGLLVGLLLGLLLGFLVGLCVMLRVGEQGPWKDKIPV